MKIEDTAINQLMMAEDTGGEAGWNLYQSYARYNGGAIFVIVMTVCMFGWTIANTFFNIWLT